MDFDADADLDALLNEVEVPGPDTEVEEVAEIADGVTEIPEIRRARRRIAPHKPAKTKASATNTALARLIKERNAKERKGLGSEYYAQVRAMMVGDPEGEDPGTYQVEDLLRHTGLADAVSDTESHLRVDFKSILEGELERSKEARPGDDAIDTSAFWANSNMSSKSTITEPSVTSGDGNEVLTSYFDVKNGANASQKEALRILKETALTEKFTLSKNYRFFSSLSSAADATFVVSQCIYLACLPGLRPRNRVLLDTCLDRVLRSHQVPSSLDEQKLFASLSEAFVVLGASPRLEVLNCAEMDPRLESWNTYYKQGGDNARAPAVIQLVSIIERLVTKMPSHLEFVTGCGVLLVFLSLHDPVVENRDSFASVANAMGGNPNIMDRLLHRLTDTFKESSRAIQLRVLIGTSGGSRNQLLLSAWLAIAFLQPSQLRTCDKETIMNPPHPRVLKNILNTPCAIQEPETTLIAHVKQTRKINIAFFNDFFDIFVFPLNILCDSLDVKDPFGSGLIEPASDFWDELRELIASLQNLEARMDATALSGWEIQRLKNRIIRCHRSLNFKMEACVGAEDRASEDDE